MLVYRSGQGNHTQQNIGGNTMHKRITFEWKFKLVGECLHVYLNEELSKQLFISHNLFMSNIAVIQAEILFYQFDIGHKTKVHGIDDLYKALDAYRGAFSR